MGFTLHNTNIFAHRAAPIQVNYLGYPAWASIHRLHRRRDPGSRVQPPAFTSSKDRLPARHLPKPDSRSALLRSHHLRAAEDLPEQGFVFCRQRQCRDRPRHLRSPGCVSSPAFRAHPGCSRNNPTAAVNLRKEAAQRGILPIASASPSASRWQSTSPASASPISSSTPSPSTPATASPRCGPACPCSPAWARPSPAASQPPMSVSFWAALSSSSPRHRKNTKPRRRARHRSRARLVALREKLDRGRLHLRTLRHTASPATLKPPHRDARPPPRRLIADHIHIAPAHWP